MRDAFIIIVIFLELLFVEFLDITFANFVDQKLVLRPTEGIVGIVTSSVGRIGSQILIENNDRWLLICVIQIPRHNVFPTNWRLCCCHARVVNLRYNASHTLYLSVICMLYHRQIMTTHVYRMNARHITETRRQIAIQLLVSIAQKVSKKLALIAIVQS